MSVWVRAEAVWKEYVGCTVIFFCPHLHQNNSQLGDKCLNQSWDRFNCILQRTFTSKMHLVSSCQVGESVNKVISWMSGLFSPSWNLGSFLSLLWLMKSKIFIWLYNDYLAFNAPDICSSAWQSTFINRKITAWRSALWHLGSQPFWGYVRCFWGQCWCWWLSEIPRSNSA